MNIVPNGPERSGPSPPGVYRATDTASPGTTWDVFVSYVRTDAVRVRPLVAALREHGLRVFLDESDITTFTSISATIVAELARSKAMVAFYSTDYPHRRACQWELTTAYLAGYREGDPRRRVLVVNPERSADHIHPVELRDARHGSPASGADLGALVANIRAHITRLTGEIGTVAAPTTARWLPAPIGGGSPRFAGRITELWHVHSALHPHSATLLTGATAAGAAQVRGLAGIGKSLLAEEYARRFSVAFPGGTYWLRLGSSRQPRFPVLRAYQRQVATIAVALGVRAADQRIEGLLTALAMALERQGLPCLWVVDGLPDGLRPEHVRLLCGPHPLAATLFTTRSRRYDALAAPLDLEPLPPDDAHALLVAGRPPASVEENEAAWRLTTDLGGHPLGVDVLRTAVTGYPGTSPYRDTLTATTHPHTDPLTTEPGGTALRHALVPDLLALPDAALDVVRILAALWPSMPPLAVLCDTLVTADQLTPDCARRLVTRALSGLSMAGFVMFETPGMVRSHPVLLRILRAHDPDPVRRETLCRAALVTLIPGVTSMGGTRNPPARTERPPPMSHTRLMPTDPARSAAYELLVELVTRVGVQRLADGEGSLREALSSLHSLFPTTRALLARYQLGTAGGSAGATQDLHDAVDRLLNDVLRPFLTHWHPLLSSHEATRPDTLGTHHHEQAWEQAPALRGALAALRDPLVAVADTLADISGTDLGPTGTR